MENRWHKITLSKEQSTGDILYILKDKITAIYNAHDKQVDFACFFTARNAQSAHTIYLSPKASIECEFILNDYNASACNIPDYSSMGFFSGNEEFSA